MDRDSEFRRELEKLINRYSMESGSNTADFVLAQFMMECLYAFNGAVRHRERLRERHETPV